MSKINIQGFDDINDPFYRYKMEKLNVIKQRTKTIVDNIDIVAKNLERDPKLIVDYLKKKLGIAIIYKNNILSMTSNIDYQTLETCLREFIEFYILCQTCRLPETIIQINNDKIILICRCCSYKTYRNIKK